MNTKLKPGANDAELVKDGYEAIIGSEHALFSGPFISGLIGQFKALATSEKIGLPNPEKLGTPEYDAFDYGAHRAICWWNAQTGYIKRRYRMGGAA